MSAVWNSPRSHGHEQIQRDDHINNGYKTVDRIAMQELFKDEDEQEIVRIDNSQSVYRKKKKVVHVTEKRPGPRHNHRLLKF